MARFRFREGFWLLLDNNITDTSRIRFEAGEQDVPDDLADHWFLAEMGERIDVAPPSDPEPSQAAESITIEPDGSTHVDTAEEVSEKAALRATAESLGISVDGRWGVDRLNAEIEAAKAAAAPAATEADEPVLGDAPPAAPITPDPESPAE